MDGLTAIDSVAAIDSATVMDAGPQWMVDGALAIRWQKMARWRGQQWTAQWHLNGDG
jgi:hypothetical protein